MKNNLVKGFKFEIVISCIISFLLMAITEIAFCLIVNFSINTFYNIKYKSKIDNLKENIINNSIKIQGNKDYGKFEIEKQVERFKISFPILVIILVIMGIVLFVLYFMMLIRKYINYLEHISKVMSNISEGNFDAKADIRFNDEFTLIAKNLNKMTQDIQQIIESERGIENTKNEMIASVAHDLRTPLTSIIGYLGLVLKKDNINIDTKDKYINIAYNKSLRLQKLIEDLFTYTKFNFDDVIMKFSNMDLVKLIEQVLDEFYPNFEEFGLYYKFETNKPSIIINADGDMLARLFANLVSNAIKYGKDGKVIRIKIIEKQNEVVVKIINYGELIPKEDLENIFDMFYRVEASRSVETGGTGLGLTIAKNIVQCHGGDISVKSDFNGTEFKVRFYLNQNLEDNKKTIQQVIENIKREDKL